MGIITRKRNLETQSAGLVPLRPQHITKILALLFWLAVVGLYWWITDLYNLSPAMKVILLQDLFTTEVYGPLLFIVFFALQPLVFFPSFVLGIAGGMLYGPVAGTLLVTIGANGAANVLFGGALFRMGVVEAQSKQGGLIRRYMDGARNHTFETILMLHLLFVPFDLVNYLAGFFRMNWPKFALATVIGAIPGILSFVLFGASLEGDLLAGKPELNLSMLVGSAVILITGIILAQLVKRRDIKREKIGNH